MSTAATAWLAAHPGAVVVVAAPDGPEVGVALPDGSPQVADLVATLSSWADAGPADLLELVVAGASMVGVAEIPDPDGFGAGTIAQVNELLATAGRPMLVEALPADGPAPTVIDLRAPAVSRRAVIALPSPVSAEDAHPARRIADAMVSLGCAAQPSGIPRLAAKRCAGSGECARGCPEQALQVELTELAPATSTETAVTQFGLVLDPSRCSGCLRCLSLCPEQAIEATGELTWESVLSGDHTLRRGLLRPCGRCGSPHASPGELCRLCSWREANPFGSMMPPGLAQI